MSTPRLAAVGLMGATGTGKSALAMRLAGEFDTSIVCCDSMQVYRGLDVGTAKPTPDERRQVRHGLVDCCELPERYSAARWAEAAGDWIARENSHGRKPLIVGGTGLYLRALLEGFADIPPEDKGVRAHLLAELEQQGTPHMHQLLAQCDAETAARLAPNDTQRILRALGVQRTTGKPLSQWQRQGRSHADIDCQVFVLELDRERLRSRLADRFYDMLEAGWLDEVRWLDSLQLADDHPARRSVGYRQLLDHLHGLLDYDQAVADGITATRRYAKRQQTWFMHQTPDAVHGDAEFLEIQLREAMR